MRECLTIRKKLAVNPNPAVSSWQIANVNSMLGAALSGQERYTDAEPLLLAGYNEMKKHEAEIPPQGKIRLLEAVERLVQLSVANGQQEKADEWRAKLEADTAKSATD